MRNVTVRAALACAAIAAICAAVWISSPSAADSEPEPTSNVGSAVVVDGRSEVAMLAVHDGDLVEWLAGVARGEWYAGVQRQMDADYIAGVQRWLDEQAALRTSRSAASTYHPGTTDAGECTGFAIPSYIIQRESGGNPSAYNPSGAYGCAQTLLTHYSRGSCQGLDPYTIQGQRDCVDILSAGGTNLQPWAQTR